MKLGFVSAILPDLALEAVLGYAARLGYDCVELMCWPPGRADRRYAGVTHLDVTGFTPDMAARTRQLCQTAGVAISGLGYYPNPLSPDMAEAAVAVDHLGLVIQAAALLGVPQVNTFVGRARCWPTSYARSDLSLATNHRPKKVTWHGCWVRSFRAHCAADWCW